MVRRMVAAGNIQLDFQCDLVITVLITILQFSWLISVQRGHHFLCLVALRWAGTAKVEIENLHECLHLNIFWLRQVRTPTSYC
jgi:hypothetical protein